MSLCLAQSYFGNAVGENLFLTWLLITMGATVFTLLMSGLLFRAYYVKPTYEQWKYKINPKYPSPQMVRSEIILMLQGVVVAAFCPALSFYLSTRNLSNTFCGDGGYSWQYHVMCFFVLWIGTDLFEWAYHYLGHVSKFFWNIHKYHHTFYNPSPFAVIADEWVDQFARTTPVLIIPLLLPVNLDLLWAIFSFFFYGYGVYLHWGFESPLISAHNPIINSSYQHFCHHAVSIIKKPYHTGFFFKIWDQLAGSIYDKPCFCSECARAKGERSEEAFAKVVKPDYSVLLKPSFWWKTPAFTFANSTKAQ